jgi:hypothetical protein
VNSASDEKTVASDRRTQRQAIGLREKCDVNCGFLALEPLVSAEADCCQNLYSFSSTDRGGEGDKDNVITEKPILLFVSFFGPQIALAYRLDAISQGLQKSRFPGSNPLPLVQVMDAARINSITHGAV